MGIKRWPWTLSDFVVMGILLFSTGLTYEFIKSRGGNTVYRAAAGLAILTTFLLTWANLAVGIIGGENNPANLLYFAVPLVGIIGATITGFNSRGMMYTLFAMAITQMFIPLIALMIWSPRITSWTPGVFPVLGINGFFATLFVGSALLFRHTNVTRSNKRQEPKQG